MLRQRPTRGEPHDFKSHDISRRHPQSELEVPGYHSYWYSADQKGYSGTGYVKLMECFLHELWSLKNVKVNDRCLNVMEHITCDL